MDESKDDEHSHIPNSSFTIPTNKSSSSSSSRQRYTQQPYVHSNTNTTTTNTTTTSSTERTPLLGSSSSSIVVGDTVTSSTKHTSFDSTPTASSSSSEKKKKKSNNNNNGNNQPRRRTNSRNRNKQQQQQQQSDYTSSGNLLSSSSDSKNHNHKNTMSNNSTSQSYYTSPQSQSQSHAPQQQQQASLDSRPTSQHYAVSTQRSLRLLDSVDIPDDVHSVRKRALSVLLPLTNIWLIVSTGLATSAAMSCLRVFHFYPTLPYWMILMPSWCAHAGVFFCHVKGCRNLGKFIQQANDSRQHSRQTSSSSGHNNSTASQQIAQDYHDRQEYLPLLQRSLKYGLKTGSLCFLLFVFQLLVFLHLREATATQGDAYIQNVNTCLLPLWVLVVGGLLDGIVCKTQSFLRVVCWILLFTSMLLLVVKVDYNLESVNWFDVTFPLFVNMCICAGSLIYVLYGHQLGYFQLTENQYMAGIMYCISIFMIFCLLVVLSEVIPGMAVDMQTAMFVTFLSPLIIILIGLGAWGVSKDEYRRMLLLGGQQSVHPMRLRLEPAGWTCVQSRGVTLMPMLGEVSYEPLDKDRYRNSEDGNDGFLEMCSFSCCLSCYPLEDKDAYANHCHDEEQQQRQQYSAPNSHRYDTSSSPSQYQSPQYRRTDQPNSSSTGRTGSSQQQHYTNSSQGAPHSGTNASMSVQSPLPLTRMQRQLSALTAASIPQNNTMTSVVSGQNSVAVAGDNFSVRSSMTQPGNPNTSKFTSGSVQDSQFVSSQHQQISRNPTGVSTIASNFSGDFSYGTR